MQKIGSLRSINPYNPFLGMWIALTRQPRWTDEPLHPEQRISREQAIRLYTAENGWFFREEAKLGSIEPGKLGDLVVLSNDYFDPKKVPDEELKALKSVLTVVDGKIVYDALR